MIHPRRNRNFQTPRVSFSRPQSPESSSSEVSSITLPDTPTLTSQHNNSNIPSDYLGSTPTSEQIPENPITPLPPPTPPNDYHIGQHNLTHKENQT